MVLPANENKVLKHLRIEVLKIFKQNDYFYIYIDINTWSRITDIVLTRYILGLLLVFDIISLCHCTKCCMLGSVIFGFLSTCDTVNWIIFFNEVHSCDDNVATAQVAPSSLLIDLEINWNVSEWSETSMPKWMYSLYIIFWCSYYFINTCKDNSCRQ